MGVLSLDAIESATLFRQQKGSKDRGLGGQGVEAWGRSPANLLEGALALRPTRRLAGLNRLPLTVEGQAGREGR